MNRKQVEEYIGKENWDAFDKWMYGQTFAFINGEVDYYKHDVEAFKQKLEKGYDRQKDNFAWD